jgi:surfeit locus 1 family protein
VTGEIAPGGTFGGTLYAAQPPAGLQPLAPPDPSDVPNNHLSYAVQWFFFALSALVIYVLALRKRWREG